MERRSNGRSADENDNDPIREAEGNEAWRSGPNRDRRSDRERGQGSEGGQLVAYPLGAPRDKRTRHERRGRGHDHDAGDDAEGIPGCARQDDCTSAHDRDGECRPRHPDEARRKTDDVPVARPSHPEPATVKKDTTDGEREQDRTEQRRRRGQQKRGRRWCVGGGGNGDSRGSEPERSYGRESHVISPCQKDSQGCRNREPPSAHDPPGRPGDARARLSGRAAASDTHARTSARRAPDAAARASQADADPRSAAPTGANGPRTAAPGASATAAPVTAHTSAPPAIARKRCRLPRAAAITPSARTAPAGTAATVARASATPPGPPPGSSTARAIHKATSEGSTVRTAISAGTRPAAFAVIPRSGTCRDLLAECRSARE